jgi:hypothetical protein
LNFSKIFHGLYLGVYGKGGIRKWKIEGGKGGENGKSGGEKRQDEEEAGRKKKRNRMGPHTLFHLGLRLWFINYKSLFYE